MSERMNEQLPEREAAARMIEKIQMAIRRVQEEKGGPVLVAIDGRCASGKSTLADRLQDRMNCNLIHMDDFFLRPEQRTAQRLQEPGGNVDYERVREEVVLPLMQQGICTYRPYDCQTQTLSEPVSVQENRVTIIEGSYSCHPTLIEYYDLKIFLTVDPEEQMRRITLREGESYAQVFKERWIPLEERYFEAYSVKDHCDLCLRF